MNKESLSIDELKFLLGLIRTRYNHEIRRPGKLDSYGRDVQASKTWRLGSIMLKLEKMYEEERIAQNDAR